MRNPGNLSFVFHFPAPSPLYRRRMKRLGISTPSVLANLSVVTGIRRNDEPNPPISIGIDRLTLKFLGLVGAVRERGPFERTAPTDWHIVPATPLLFFGLAAGFLLG